MGLDQGEIFEPDGFRRINSTSDESLKWCGGFNNDLFNRIPSPLHAYLRRNQDEDDDDEYEPYPDCSELS